MNAKEGKPNHVPIGTHGSSGAHDLILRFENGYETRIGEAGSSLSAGQRQRIGLARALYGNPFLVVLDEPNANLDVQGETAVVSAIDSVRERKGIAVVIAHRPSALGAVDYVMVIEAGRMKAFGPRDEVLSKVLKVSGLSQSNVPPSQDHVPVTKAVAPFRVIANSADGRDADGFSSEGELDVKR